MRVLQTSFDGMRKIAESEKVIQFYEKINDEIQKCFFEIDCGNIVISSIMLEFRDRINESEIAFSWEGHIKETLAVNDIDLATLFGNLLLNAIEECERIEGEKIIHISFLQETNNSLIIIENTTNNNEENIKKQKTSKKNKSEHGIGLNSVNSILGKYEEAFCVAKIIDGKYVVKLTLPLQQI